MSDVWTKGRALSRAEDEQPFHAWYELTSAGDLDVNRTVPDRIIMETDDRIAATSPWDDNGLLRVSCVTKPGEALRRGEIEELMPDPVVIVRKVGGVYKSEGGERAEIPTETKVYRLRGLNLRERGPSYDDAMVR